MHTKRTGHTDFVDKTSEVTKPISLEVPKKVDADESSAAAPMDVDATAGADSQGILHLIAFGRHDNFVDLLLFLLYWFVFDNVVMIYRFEFEVLK